MRKIILASNSPRRQELLKDIVVDFEIEPSDVDESVDADVKALDIPQILAVRKACDIAFRHSGCIVIGSDTVVIVNDEVLGKPKDDNDAYRMLKMLSNTEHIVCTGCAIVCDDKVRSFSVVTKVLFNDLTDNEIYEYIDSKDGADKAGAYGIQSKGKTLVKGITGDYFNVVGLPVSRLKRELKDFISMLDNT